MHHFLPNPIGSLVKSPATSFPVCSNAPRVHKPQVDRKHLRLKWEETLGTIEIFWKDPFVSIIKSFKGHFYVMRIVNLVCVRKKRWCRKYHRKNKTGSHLFDFIVVVSGLICVWKQSRAVNGSILAWHFRLKCSNKDQEHNIYLIWVQITIQMNWIMNKTFFLKCHKGCTHINDLINNYFGKIYSIIIKDNS